MLLDFEKLKYKNYFTDNRCNVDKTLLIWITSKES